MSNMSHAHTFLTLTREVNVEANNLDNSGPVPPKVQNDHIVAAVYNSVKYFCCNFCVFITLCLSCHGVELHDFIHVQGC